MFMSIWWTAAGFIHLIGEIFFLFPIFCACWWSFQILFWNSVAALKQFHGNPTLQKTTVILRISPTARTSPTLSKTPCFVFFGKNIFFFYFWNVRLWLIWKLIFYIQVCILHDCDNVYSGLWRYLSYDQDWKVSISKSHINIGGHTYNWLFLLLAISGCSKSCSWW